MEVPLNLDVLNARFDALSALEIEMGAKVATRIRRRLITQRRIVVTQSSASSGSPLVKDGVAKSEKMRGGTILLSTPASMPEARRWVQRRPFEEEICGLWAPKDRRGMYLTRSTDGMTGSHSVPMVRV